MLSVCDKLSHGEKKRWWNIIKENTHNLGSQIELIISVWNWNKLTYLEWIEAGGDSPVLYRYRFAGVRVLAFAVGTFAGASLVLATSFKHQPLCVPHYCHSALKKNYASLCTKLAAALFFFFFFAKQADDASFFPFFSPLSFPLSLVLLIALRRCRSSSAHVVGYLSSLLLLLLL